MVYPIRLDFRSVPPSDSIAFSFHNKPPTVGSSEPEVEEVALPPTPKPPKKKSSEYRWVVDVLGVAGAIGGGILFGVPGIIIGGALLATGGVPLRRWLAQRENPAVLEKDLSLGGEMAVTGGASLLFGGVFVGLAGVARIAATRLSTAVATRVAAHTARRTVVGRVLQKVAEGTQPFREWYVQGGSEPARFGGHIPLRLGTGAVAAYDLAQDGSLDTTAGFVAAIYSGNLVYGRFFGTNPFGLDTAAPASVASYQLFRVLAGAKATDFSDFNYNEAFLFRYIAEFGNILQSSAAYGRAYWRPGLRPQMAREMGLVANTSTGTVQTSPFGWVMDQTLGRAYRSRFFPRWVRTVVRPSIRYPVGPLVNPHRFDVSTRTGRWGQSVADRLTILRGFRNNDIMQPIYGPTGRLVKFGHVWGLVVPWWMWGAPVVGMSSGEWGPNRYWKLTAWSLIGAPVKDGLGGDTPVAQAVGFGIGMAIDAVVTQFYNPRYQKKHWEEDLHESLAAFQNHPAQSDAMATHIFDEIFCRQMTDWSLRHWVQGEGLYEYNDDYLGTFNDVLKTLSSEERDAMEAIYQNRLQASASQKFSHRQQEGLAILAGWLGTDGRATVEHPL